MKINGIGSFNSIYDYVRNKISIYELTQKDLKSLFEAMFSDPDNVIAETSDGFRIKTVTYGKCKQDILSLAPVLYKELCSIEAGSMVGLYMDNSLNWIKMFWAIIICGYKPLLMNLRMSKATLEQLITDNSVAAVVSDSEVFCVKTVMANELLDTQSSQQMPDVSWGDEVIFMSSGTTSTPKLCIYNGECLFRQVIESYNIIKKCPQMVKSYEREIKQLALLPFYHVFGFMAVYLWFGFFGRTFVFLKDMHPQTLINTVRKHKVTHIFAVPLVWEKIYAEAIKKINAKGEQTVKKFEKGVRLANGNSPISSLVSHHAFKEVRDNIFGDSICFLISGGSGISCDVLAFFNAIGYHMANGYGMTEIGITSVDLSKRSSELITASVGAPFGQCQYKIQNGELLVCGKNMACRIIKDGTQTDTSDTWFATNDLAREQDGKYYILGRRDDLIICRNGENLNPEIVERELSIPGCDGVCIFAHQGEPVLLISTKGIYSQQKLNDIKQSALAALDASGVREVISKIALTSDPLIQGNDFKVNRKKIASLYAEGKLTLLDPDSAESQKQLLDGLAEKIRLLFAQALQLDAQSIGDDDDFFTDLGGSSLDYFMLLDSIKENLGADCSEQQGIGLSSVRAFYERISKS